MLGEARVTHVTPKRLGLRPLKAKAALFSIAALDAVLNLHAVLSACPIIFPANLTACRRLEGSAQLAQSEMR
jgi:hypothetical protein